MPNIIQLDRHTADLIAAGEVVERPASVVKELMENAIDAGATHVTVEIRSGGMAYIRITDNGCGILPDDVETAFLRHATSKLRDAKGLESIATLGFRGEALAAISAVSRMELISCCSDDGEGRRVVNEGGRVLSNEACGCPRGTTMIVRDLFYNTPARLKFMKTDRAEGSAVTAVVIKAALSYPNVSVKYIKEGSTELHTPGDGKPESCIYSLFGRDFYAGLLPVNVDDGTVRVTGYISRPSHVKGNRSSQYFFVNGRSIRSRTLQAVLEQAYRNTIFTGKYPACVLYITVSCAAVDVNVHPTKSEVKFSNEKAVNDAVYYAALGALEQASPLGSQPAPSAVHESGPRNFQAAASPVPAPAARPLSSRSSGLSGTVKPRSDAFRTMSADSFRSYAGSSGGFRSSPAVSAGISSHPVRHDQADTPVPAHAEPVQQEQLRLPDDPVSVKSEAQPVTESIPEMPAALPYRIIGEALTTYIIVEQGDSLWLIDKHAAHERMHFDRLKAQKQETMVQPLLLPVICSFSPDDTELLLENHAILDDLGFSVEAFGRDSLAIRQIPSHIEQEDAEEVLSDICKELARGGRESLDDRSDRILHTIACKAAIKAGKLSNPEELAVIVEKVMSGQVRYCPHGRPVSFEMSKDMLDKSFKRT